MEGQIGIMAICCLRCWILQLLTKLQYAEMLEQGDYDTFIDCFSEIHPRLLTLAHFMPVSVSPPLAGFWKSLEGLYDDDFQRRAPEHFKLLMRCWSTDFIGHGSKSIGTWAWSGREDKNGSVPNCLYNTPEEELVVAKQCCLWHFSGEIARPMVTGLCLG